MSLAELRRRFPFELWLIIGSALAIAQALEPSGAAAQGFGADPLPFVMAVAFGASACFLMPFGYQTHLMVYSPGRYRIRDFLKTGLPVSVVYAATALVLTPLVFPF